VSSSSIEKWENRILGAHGALAVNDFGLGLKLAEESEVLGLEDAFEEQEQDRAGDHEDQGQRETEADHGRRGPYPFIPVEATLWT